MIPFYNIICCLVNSKSFVVDVLEIMHILFVNLKVSHTNNIYLYHFRKKQYPKLSHIPVSKSNTNLAQNFRGKVPLTKTQNLF